MNKLFSTAVFTFILLGFGVSIANAQTQVQTKNSLQARIIIPPCREAEVTPGNPLRLSGSGNLSATGYGETHFRVQRGYLEFKGRGILAVKSSNNDTVEVKGMGGKTQIGEWTLYWGRGYAKIQGDDFAVVTFGRHELNGKGTGNAVFRGNWKVKYCSLEKLSPEAIPEVIPSDLKAEVAE